MTIKTSPARDSKGRYVKKVTTTTTTTTSPVVLKNYIGISRDHSGSMSSITRAAARDYNSNIAAIQTNSLKEKQDTVVSVVKCGVGSRGTIVREVVNSTVAKLEPLNEYSYTADGGSTPLFDSVMDLISQFRNVPDAKDPNVSFLVMAITDGGDNSSQTSGRELANTIANLQATDHWTFVFRVPLGYKSQLTKLGIPEGNILEWEQTAHGVEVAARATETAYTSYFSGRSAGLTSTQNFYTTDLSNVSKATVKAKLVDISNDVVFFNVTEPVQIREFVERRTGRVMVKGAAFYQLTKKEDEVQDYKQLAIRDKKTGKVYSGVEARNILGLPHNGTVKVAPGNHGAYDIFIQSTSVNRKLVPGTQLLYWSKVGASFQ